VVGRTYSQTRCADRSSEMSVFSQPLEPFSARQRAGPASPDVRAAASVVIQPSFTYRPRAAGHHFWLTLDPNPWNWRPRPRRRVTSGAFTSHFTGCSLADRLPGSINRQTIIATVGRRAWRGAGQRLPRRGLGRITCLGGPRTPTCGQKSSIGDFVGGRAVAGPTPRAFPTPSQRELWQCGGQILGPALPGGTGKRDRGQPNGHARCPTPHPRVSGPFLLHHAAGLGNNAR